MDPGTSAAEAAIHVALFVAGGLAVAVGALAAVERLAGDGRRVVRVGWIAGTAGLFAALFVLERVYHAL